MNRAPKLRFPEFNGVWEKKKLEDIVNIYDGTHQTPTYVEHGVKFVSVENINDIENTNKYITEEAYEKDFKIKPQMEDILMTRITAGIIGATSIIKTNDPLGFYVSLALLRKKEGLSAEFISHYINGIFFKKELNKRIIHVAFPKKINLGDIGKCGIAVTSLPEQQEIASFLSSVDSKIEKLERKKELWEQYKKGMMQKIFSQELRFKDENGEDYPKWEEKMLNEILSAHSSGISNNTLEENNGTYPIYGATGFIKNIDFYEMDKNYIAIVKDGAGAGRTLYCMGYSSILATLQYLILKGENNLKFCYYLLNILDFNKYVVGSTIPHIYFKDYGSEKFRIPSLTEQQKISNFLSAIDSKIEIVDRELTGMKEFKNGLLQQMFV